jgi:tether containing UBX domain for GLUT4
MASSVYVVDSSLKRTQIKVTPGKYLREVLEEACKTRRLNPESWVLKSQDGKKTIDLSQPFRLSGLSPGAKLQLVQGSKSPSVVTVALQLPESEGNKRLQDKFPSTTSLWLVLRKFEDAVAGGQQKINLTQRAVPANIGSGSGRLEYEQPCLNLMGRNQETFADLQKTLAQLGFNSGNVMIRLNFKSSGQPLEEAMKEIERYFSAADPAPAGAQGSEGAHAGPSAGVMESKPDASADNGAVPADGDAGPEPAEPVDATMEDAPTAQTVEDDVIASSTETAVPPTSFSEKPPTEPASPPSNVVNGITVYRPSSSSTPAAALQEDDPATYEPSIEHAKAHQAALQRSTRNTRLLSDKEIEEQEATRQASLALVQTVQVRVKYPDQSMIETEINASDTAADLYAKVQGTLAQSPEPFELRTIGNKGFETIPNKSTKRLVRDLGFRGRMLVTLVWSPEASAKARQGPSLKDEYRSRAQELKVELQTQQSAGEESHRTAMKQPDKKDPGKGGTPGNIEDKMKKFLGFGKKK